MQSEYSNFSPKAYLHDYFMENEYDYDEESQFLLEFFHNAYRKIGPRNSLLEIGGGPIIYSIISASSHVNEIFFSDYLEENLDEVRKWLQNKKDSFNWDKYFELVLKLESKELNPENLQSIKERLRGKVKKLLHCDIFKENPLEAEYEPFDIVASNFCPESIAHNEEPFLQAVKNITSLIAPNGFIVMTLLRNGTSYKVGSESFQAFPVNEKLVSRALGNLGFAKIEIESISINDKNRGYDGLMALTAKKTQ